MVELHVNADGFLSYNGKKVRCALGKTGMSDRKVEGDNATPIGSYAIRYAYYRPDRLDAPKTAGLEVKALTETDGWCDAPEHPDYNRPVQLPFEPSHEKLWRDDPVYDVIVVLGHNDDPPIPGQGSAIFFHLAREGYSPTEGCVAVTLKDMLDILKSCDTNSWLTTRVV